MRFPTAVICTLSAEHLGVQIQYEEGRNGRWGKEYRAKQSVYIWLFSEFRDKKEKKESKKNMTRGIINKT